jgi:hypothetical protein
MFHLRSWQDSDQAALAELHEKNKFPYPIPTEMSEMVVVTDETTGAPVMFIGAKAIREVYMWVDPKWSTPIWRWTAFKVAHENLREQVLAKGITEVIAFIHARTPKGFGRRLVRHLGWVKLIADAFAKDLTR